MPKNLSFWVFLKDEYRVKTPAFDFTEKIPCFDFFALDIGAIIPKDFYFCCDSDSLSWSECEAIHNRFENPSSNKDIKEEDLTPLIPLEAIKLVKDDSYNDIPLEQLKESWIISNHVHNTETIDWNTNGSTIHTVIMGLQQALFIKSSEYEIDNDLYLSISCKLIHSLTQGHPTLKQYYLNGFPCEYITVAKQLLFPE